MTLNVANVTTNTISLVWTDSLAPALFTPVNAVGSGVLTGYFGYATNIPSQNPAFGSLTPTTLYGALIGAIVILQSVAGSFLTVELQGNLPQLFFSTLTIGSQTVSTAGADVDFQGYDPTTGYTTWVWPGGAGSYNNAMMAAAFSANDSFAFTTVNNTKNFVVTCAPTTPGDPSGGGYISTVLATFGSFINAGTAGGSISPVNFGNIPVYGVNGDNTGTTNKDLYLYFLGDINATELVSISGVDISGNPYTAYGANAAISYNPTSHGTFTQFFWENVTTNFPFPPSGTANITLVGPGTAFTVTSANLTGTASNPTHGFLNAAAAVEYGDVVDSGVVSGGSITPTTIGNLTVVGAAGRFGSIAVLFAGNVSQASLLAISGVDQSNDPYTLSGSEAFVSYNPTPNVTIFYWNGVLSSTPFPISGTSILTLITPGTLVNNYNLSRNSVVIDHFANNIFSFVDTGLTPNTTYNYSITGVDGSNTAIYTPALANATTLPQINTITLTWNFDPQTTYPIQSFQILRSVGSIGGPYSQIGTVDGRTFSYVDHVSVQGITYYYEIVAVDSAFQMSLPSNILSATPVVY